MKKKCQNLGVRSRRGKVGAKHSENSLVIKLIISCPNASPSRKDFLSNP
ncbi:hypothetical protein H5968_06705 [Sphaerospermopsis sp. LEGE 00249]|nr:hypothetical protein [Sphaerospermopsis sp. LEGE 00249]